MNGFEEFEFDLPRALKVELISLLDGMKSAPLQSTSTKKLPEAQGIYQLFHKGSLVYVGKTDAESGLRTRLSRHAQKIMHRPTLTGAVRYKAVRLMVFTAMDLETQLIGHYRALKNGSAAWNGSGFGSNDPGRRRETTNRQPDGFDNQHPISIDLKGEYLAPGSMPVATALSTLKSTLPYTLRYETLRDERGRAQRTKPHLELLKTSVVIPKPPHTVRELMHVIRNGLGSKWQATLFASHVILYKEQHVYHYGKVL